MGAATLEEFIFGGAPQVPSQDFQGENLRYSLHWLCLAIALLKVLFWELGLLQSEDLKSWIGQRQCLCTPSWKYCFWRHFMFSRCCILWSIRLRPLRGVDHCVGIFVFFLSFYFFVSAFPFLDKFDEPFPNSLNVSQNWWFFKNLWYFFSNLLNIFFQIRGLLKVCDFFKIHDFLNSFFI